MDSQTGCDAPLSEVYCTRRSGNKNKKKEISQEFFLPVLWCISFVHNASNLNKEQDGGGSSTSYRQLYFYFYVLLFFVAVVVVVFVQDPTFSDADPAGTAKEKT